MTNSLANSRKFEPIPPEADRISGEIIGSAIEVHRQLGPGFLESIYRKAMVHEMRLRGLTVREEMPVAILYKGLRIEGQRVDLLVKPGIIVELKTADCLLPIHDSQLISYLRTTGHRLGLLINFNCQELRKGIKRIVV